MRMQEMNEKLVEIGIQILSREGMETGGAKDESKELGKCSVSAFTHEDGARCLQQDFQIQPEGPGACILQVQPDHILETYAAAPFYLP